MQYKRLMYNEYDVTVSVATLILPDPLLLDHTHRTNVSVVT